MAAAASVALFLPALGPVALLPLAGALLLAPPWRELSDTLHALRAARSET
jgi:hypothetical protein